MSVKDSVLLIKLKDGIQDTVVFLRMLEQFKIPAVMETRRKKLLQKLLNLQGDTIRETPPSYENGDATSPSHEEGEAAKRSSVVDSKVSEYARIQTKAKEEIATFSPKKAAGTAPEVVEEEPPANEGTDYLEPASVLKRENKKGDDSGAAERPASTASNESEAKKEETEVESGAAAAAEGKGKKKRFGGGGLKGLRNKIGKRGKKTGQNVSVVLEAEGGEPENGEQEVPEQADDSTSLAGGEGERKEEEEKETKEAASAEGAAEKEVEVEEEQEEGVRITSTLEKRVPKRLGKGFNWVSITGKLKETTLVLVAGSKDKELELVGCMVSPSDAAPNGIELFSHKDQKQWVFRVESSELRERWVEELQKAINACPTEPARQALEEPEEPQEQQQQPGENPDIVVDQIDPITTSDEETTSPLKKRTSFSVSPNRAAKSKPVNEIPEQGVQMRGYVHRKKGTFGGWERAYAVVTYAAIYFTSGEEVKDYHHVCLINGSGTVKLEKKGHDKQSEGLLVRSGKNKETLSLPSSESHSWKQVIEEVLGVSQANLELGSDEEDEGAESATPTNAPKIEEDIGLYEELPAGEDIIIDEDIYEEFDDVKLSSSPPDKAAPPSLPPPRQEQRLPSPALPPRHSAEPVPSLPLRISPSLPPRNSPTPTQKKLSPQAKKFSAPLPTLQPDVGGEELYEDVVAPPTSLGGADIADEMYEDVVSSAGGGGGGGDEGGDELYEDVVSGMTQAAESPTEDYTEMDIGQGQAEQYVLMEKPRGGEEDLEVYCEVDPNSPSDKSPPVNTLSLPQKSGTKPAAVSKIVKPPPPASYTPRHSGGLIHKAPQKSKFYEEWCAVEGTNLCVYKNQKDKRVSDKLSLSEFDMVYSPAGKDGKFAFRLAKGDKIHHFTPSSKKDMTSWISALRGLAKTATLELPPGEQEIYETTENHTAESDEQISFRAGSYLRVISRDASDFWIGQLGTTPQVFTGKIGKFPTSKVTIAEDLYI